MSHRDPPRILVVDDDHDICRNLSDILIDLGYRVDAAHDGPSALELVRERAYDIALLDYKMPGMDGLTLYREINKQRAGVVSLLVTAYASPATTDEALSAGAWKVVPKPVDFRRLLGYLDEAMDQPLVMVVDDDQDLCDALWDLLREQGYRVSLAHGVREAAEQLRDSEYKVVLIDLRIPDGDGGDVYRVVRDTNPQARTIMITSYRLEMDDTVDRLMSEGVDAVCYKPFDIPQLLAKLEQLSSSARGKA